MNFYTHTHSHSLRKLWSFWSLISPQTVSLHTTMFECVFNFHSSFSWAASRTDGGKTWGGGGYPCAVSPCFGLSHNESNYWCTSFVNTYQPYGQFLNLFERDVQIKLKVIICVQSVFKYHLYIDITETRSHETDTVLSWLTLLSKTALNGVIITLYIYKYFIR